MRVKYGDNDVPISVFLPTVQFIIDSERYTLLESISGVGSEANDVACNLKTQRHIEIFRDMRLGPKLFIAVFIFIRDFLQSRPTKNSIVTDEGRHITIGDGVSDSCVDEVGEESDTIGFLVIRLLKAG
jgi:hypothetical protein